VPASPQKKEEMECRSQIVAVLISLKHSYKAICAMLGLTLTQVRHVIQTPKEKEGEVRLSRTQTLLASIRYLAQARFAKPEQQQDDTISAVCQALNSWEPIVRLRAFAGGIQAGFMYLTEPNANLPEPLRLLIGAVLKDVREINPLFSGLERSNEVWDAFLSQVVEGRINLPETANGIQQTLVKLAEQMAAEENGGKDLRRLVRLPADPDKARQTMNGVLASLIPKEETVLRQRFGIDQPARTLQQVGDGLSLGRERIRQIEAKALRKLRHPNLARQIRDLDPTVGGVESESDSRGHEIARLQQALLDHDLLIRFLEEIRIARNILSGALGSSQGSVDDRTNMQALATAQFLDVVQTALESVINVEPIRHDISRLRTLTEELELSVRSSNCLCNSGIRFVGQLVQKTEADLLKSKNSGRKTLKEIKEILVDFNLTLGMNPDDHSGVRAFNAWLAKEDIE